jgi:ABC-type phosphate transport system permease subunit
MVWLSGGMFAIACTMIAGLIGFIGWKGLATHWQRPILVCALNDGGIVCGELQTETPFALNDQSLADLDPISRQQADLLIQTGREKQATQWYLRTGNYDVTNKHFTYLPRIKLAIETLQFPQDIWLMERREWGVLYGFPRRLKYNFAPEHDPQYRALVTFERQSDQWTEGIEANTLQAFKTAATEQLSQLSHKLEREFSGQEASLDDREQIRTAVKAGVRSMHQFHRKVQAAKHALGATDRSLSDLRLEIRKAELSDHSDLQAYMDEILQNAATAGTMEAQSNEALAALDAWAKLLVGNATAIECIQSLRKNIDQQLKNSLAEIAEAESSLQKEIETLPPRSRSAIQTASGESRVLAKRQYEINQGIAWLEENIHSHVLEMQLPITEGLGESAMNMELLLDAKRWDAEFASLLGLDANSIADAEIKTRLLGKSHAFIEIASPGRTSDRFLAFKKVDGQSIEMHKFVSKEVQVSDIVRFTEPNALTVLGKTGLYAARWTEFLFGEPREAGIEGGFFPAIWGTIVMTLIMSVAVMPFGVMAALYMKEYAKSGWVLSLIRISINNLAGVPSIVYGVFGLAFFCYTVGGYIDGGPKRAGFVPWPSMTWFFVLGGTACCGTLAFLLAFLGSGSPAHMTPLRKRIAGFSGVFWFASLVCVFLLLIKAPFFNGFYEASLPNPTFGKGCLLWASFTLALLTLPVVIVATEEALAAVPNSLREGSYACGAGKWQTLQRIVLPYARPGIITGFILAMARGAGEVAPMMLVGAIPLATDLPLDLDFPFFHGSRSFMHLGFQIYSLGFQSQNSEAAKPMVFTATLLLLTIVTLLNVAAIWLRARLRKRFQGSQF